MTINTNNEFVTRQEFDAFVKASVASMNIKEINKGFSYQVGEKFSKKEYELRQKQDAREDKGFVYKLYMLFEYLILVFVYFSLAINSAIKDSWKTLSPLKAKGSGIRSIAYLIVIGFSAHLMIEFWVGIYVYVKYFIMTYGLLEFEMNSIELEEKLPIIFLWSIVLMSTIYIINHSLFIYALSIMHPKWLLLKYRTQLITVLLIIGTVMMGALICKDFASLPPDAASTQHIQEYLDVIHTRFWLFMTGTFVIIVIFSNYSVSKEYMKKHPILTYDINKPTI